MRKLIVRMLRWIARRDPAVEVVGALMPVSFPIGALLAGLGAVSGFLGAREQRRAAEAASRPQPYESHDTRQPWAPAVPGLEGIAELALQAFQNRLNSRPPPRRGGGGGPTTEFRQLAAELQRRAMESQTIPRAQEIALGLLERPNSMMQGAYDRAMSYRNPFTESLFNRGMNQGFFDRGGFQNMIAGLGSRGPAVPDLPSAPPMTALPTLPPLSLPEPGSLSGNYYFNRS